MGNLSLRERESERESERERERKRERERGRKKRGGEERRRDEDGILSDGIKGGWMENSPKTQKSANLDSIELFLSKR